jgi:putative ABC transport system permease protein
LKPLKTPPDLPEKFLTFFVPDELLEEFMGDLEEIYEDRLIEHGKRYAQLMYWIDAIHFIFGFTYRSKINNQLNQLAMFRSYFKIAYRNMLRYKFFSLINVVGLAIGISMSLLIVIHLSNELSYEKDFPKHERIFRLSSNKWAKMPPLLATEFKEKLPEVKEVCRFFDFGPRAYAYGQNELLIESPFIADPSIIDMFDLQFIEGGVDALKEPSSVILTESMANRIFVSGQKRIGEVITFDGGWKQTVTGIIKDLPQNTHLKADCFISSINSFITKNESRAWSGVSIFALLENVHSLEKVRSKLFDFELAFYDGIATKQELVEANDYFELMPISDIHLQSNKEKEIETNSDISFIYIFSALAIFILIVVVINFINLFVAQSLNRIKEIGLRKVLGAIKAQLAVQFLSEAFFLVIISVLLALTIAYFALPFYNELAAISITSNQLFSLEYLGYLSILVITIGLISGGYPAYYLSRFGIREGLTNKGLNISGKLPIRTALVAFQFLISISLLSATFIVSQQMKFIQSKSMGFAEDEVVAIKLHGKLRDQAIEHREKMKAELLKYPDIAQVSFSSYLIGSRFGLEPFYLKNNPENELTPRVLIADTDLIETLGIEIVESNLKSKQFSGRKYFVNETAAQLLQTTQLLGSTGVNSWQNNEGEIVGVVKDFHFASLHQAVDPLIIQVSEEDQNALSYLLIRTKTQNLSATLEKINTTLTDIAPGALIVTALIDENMELSYRAEASMFAIFKLFSTIIIGLACIGLFALFAFVAQAKTKEMGIRKTLGASMGQLLFIMSKSYIIILVIIVFIAVPITWYFSSDWLNNFAFRMDLKWWHFIIPALTVLSLAGIAIVFQSWKVATRNPVDSLKSE